VSIRGFANSREHFVWSRERFAFRATSHYPRRVSSTADRLPPLAAAQMSPDQQAVAAELVSGRRGALYGPFVPALRSPEFTRRLGKVGEYLRYEAALPPRLREMTILLVARTWTQDFEWDVHAPLAAQEGLASEVIDAIAEGRRPEPAGIEELLVYDFFMELQRTHAVSDRTYDAAVAAFGEAGVIDFVGLVGYYSTLAMIMNVARTPLPDGKAPVLPSLPR
jgi:4-carboxymuconolactone decarboxylase